MDGKICVITGATSGIGQAAAFALARMGARIIVVARNKERADATLAELSAISPGVEHRAYFADLSLIADTKRLAAEIAAAEPRVDVLINNAAELLGSFAVTREGLEHTFALNHMAYFVLTEGLRKCLFAASPARVINTAGRMHKIAKFRTNSQQIERGYRGGKAYAHSKLCNILFTRELARRWAGHGVTANCLDPGVMVATRLGDRAGGLVGILFGIMKLVGISPETGAQTIVHLASSSQVAGVTGGYFRKCRQVAPSSEAANDKKAGLLWDESLRLAERNGDRGVSTGLVRPGGAFGRRVFNRTLNGGVGIAALILILIGARFLIAPESAVAYFGIPASISPELTAYLAVKGIRDIAFGLLIIGLLLARQRKALPIALAALAFIAGSDTILVLLNRGSLLIAFGVHGLAALLAGGLAFGLWRRSSSTLR